MSDENVRQTNQCVCRHNQAGFCKYGDQCQKQHVNQNCSITPCKEPNCIKRHPKKCKYFSEHSFCKFKNNCEYIYKEQKESVELNKYAIHAYTHGPVTGSGLSHTSVV